MSNSPKVEIFHESPIKYTCVLNSNRNTHIHFNYHVTSGHEMWNFGTGLLKYFLALETLIPEWKGLANSKQIYTARKTMELDFGFESQPKGVCFTFHTHRAWNQTFSVEIRLQRKTAVVAKGSSNELIIPRHRNRSQCLILYTRRTASSRDEHKLVRSLELIIWCIRWSRPGIVGCLFLLLYGHGIEHHTITRLCWQV